MTTEKLTKAIILLITYDCNLRCSYCYEPKKVHRKMSVQSAKNVLQRAIGELDDSYDSIIVQFMGGEPMLEFDLIREVSEWLWELDLKVRIKNVHAPTNGTVLSSEMKEWLVQNKDRFSLALSFDGNRLMHNLNRSGSADEIDMSFFANTFPDVAVKMTLSPDTIGYFYEGYKFLHEQGFNEIGPSLAIGDNIGWEKKHLMIMNEQLDLLIQYFINNPDVRRVGNFALPVWNILNPEAPDLACRVGRDIVCYDCNEKAYPCHIFSPIAMDANKSEESTYIDFEKTRKLSGPCSRCLLNKVCSRCFGINYRDRGNCMMPSAFDCAQFKLFFYANCKLQTILAYKNKDKDMSSIMDKVNNILKHIKS